MKTHAHAPDKSKVMPEKAIKRVPLSIPSRDERDARYLHWLEHGSNSLEDAWVSICPHAQSHDVEPLLLSEVVEAIRTGGAIEVRTNWGCKEINLAQNQKKIRNLFHAGEEEAELLNRKQVINLLYDLGLNVDLTSVETVLDEQSGGRANASLITSILIAGVKHPIREPVPYHQPQASGKARANDAKKWTPGVTLAGVFCGQRKKNNLYRTTGLYPLDLDGIDDLAEVRAMIEQ